MNKNVQSEHRSDAEMVDQPTAQPAAFTFTLPTLFYLTTVYGISCYLGTAALALTTCVLLAWWSWFGATPSDGRRNIRTLIAMLAISAVVMSGLLPSMGTPRSHTRMTECQHRIRQLASATLDYEGAHGHFPAAYINDENGNPMHSWRVMILPHLGYDALFAQYNFSEPWDGPNNIELVNQMPDGFECPSHQHNGKTTYKLVTGPATAFVANETSGFGDVLDGSSNTLMIVEDFANPIPWTKPDDLSIDGVVEIMERSSHSQRSACCAHEANYKSGKTSIGTCVCLLDGSTHLIPPLSNPRQIKALCTSADGESLRIDQLESGRHVVRKLEAWALLLIYGILLSLPGWASPRHKC